jgi:hypothetical protein
MKNINRACCAAIAAAGSVAFAAVDENLPWKWDTSARAEPAAPAVLGSEEAENSFADWGYISVCTKISPCGFLIFIR